MRHSIVAVMLLLCAGTVLSPTRCNAQNPDYCVANVVFEDHGHLTLEEAASAKLRIVGRCFDNSEIETLRNLIVQALQDFGYFHPTVQEPVMRVMDEARHPMPVSLTFGIMQGQQYVIESIVWSGVKAFTADQLHELSSAQPGDIFSLSKVSQTAEGIRKFYAANGFPNAAIVSQVVPTNGNRLELRFDVMEAGPTPSN